MIFRKFIIICSLFFAAAAFAAESSLENYFEFGRKGASGLVEEEDLTDEFDYFKYNVKFAGDLKKNTDYYLKYQYYNKDYDTLENIDNIFNSAGFGINAPIYSRDDFLIKVGPDFECKDKIYQDAKDRDYEQIKFDFPITFKRASDWRALATAGINSYHYPNTPKDQLKLNAKVEAEKRFFDEALGLAAFYKLQHIERQKIANRLERTFGGAFDVRMDSTLVKSFEAGFEEGMDNTIVYEDREDSFDYKFLNWFLKTKHVLFDRLKASVKYTDLTRNYADSNHNYDGFTIENTWNFRAFEIKNSTLDLKCAYLHKQFRFPYVSNPFAYHNNSIFTEVELAKEDDWMLNLYYDTKFYNFPARRINDKIYYTAKATIEKHLLKKALLLGFDYRYTFKNFLHKLDIVENSFRLRINCRF